MHPWNPPPTSWPVPPQPTNAPPTWPQSSQNVHLFGHPSALHPTWSSSASIMPSTSSPTSLPFTSLSPAPHAVPGPQLVPTMPAPLTSEPTMAHTAPSTSHLLRHPPLHLPGLLHRLHLLRRLHHLHRLCHRHLCQVPLTHPITFNLHYKRTH